MPLVQSPHGRDEAHALPAGAPSRYRRAQTGDIANDGKVPRTHGLRIVFRAAGVKGP